MAKLKRRDLSGIYIFDTFPGETKRQPTCIEDCQPETRRKLLLTKSKEWLRDCIEQLAKTFKETTDYLVSEKCVTDEQRHSNIIQTYARLFTTKAGESAVPRGLD